jgi:hypothetical protein
MTKCVIEGCERKRQQRGLCGKHYQQQRKLGNLNQFAKQGHEQATPLFEWLMDNRDHPDKDNCLIWPFSRTSYGYGILNVGGTQHNAHHVMCVLVHGERSSSKYEAAHDCGKGHLGCVNPHHLKWKTHRKNEEDKIKHGTIHYPTDEECAILSARAKERWQRFGKEGFGMNNPPKLNADDVK